MKSNRKIQSKNIELFFDFVNESDIERLSSSKLTIFVMRYFELIEAFTEKMPSLAGTAQKREKTILAISAADNSKVAEVKKVFSKLKEKIREPLMAIVNANNNPDTETFPVVASVNITQEIVVDLGNDCFSTIYKPNGLSDELTVESELKILYIVMKTILVDYGKKPSLLGICEKDECSNLFFKFNESSMYCSTRCSNAVQQAKLRKSRKKP